MSHPAASIPSRARRQCALACGLLALALPHAVAHASEAGQPTKAGVQTLDVARQVLFIAQPDGAVRVLNLRNTVGELGMLREPQRRQVTALKLDAGGRQLWVEATDATYRYDARSLRLLQRQAHSPAQLALASAPAANAPAKLLR